MFRRVLGTTTSVVALAVGLTVTTPPVAADLRSTGQSLAYDSCPVAAHRGDHTRYTENSLNAFRKAISGRSNFLEMDVQTTRDGVFMIMHDDTVTRTTNGTGRIASKTYRQVKALRMNDGSRVPSLSEVLHLAQPSKVRLFVEIKHIPPARWALFHERLSDFGLDRVVVNGFRSADNHALPTFHAAYPDVPVAATTDFPMSVNAIAKYGAVMIDYRIIKEDWLNKMNARGLPVYAWTMDSSGPWKRYTGRIDAVITNNPQGYVAFRDRLCANGNPYIAPATPTP